ncbi:MAG: leucine-rich repeat domain-containing protein [Clostridia bacterium]|nr:leucine-rich repeat domain-containing protein [Clostridia bacterium]MDD4375592.1 leucine-rich repeat domain-containing protein [Clostridia bacterium]
MKKNNKQGISLIVLVITIIIMIILAAAIILSLNSSNIVESASETTVKSDLKNYKTKLQLYIFEKMLADESFNSENLNANKTNNSEIFEQIFPGIKDSKYYDVIGIKLGMLVINSPDDNIMDWAEEIDIMPDYEYTDMSLLTIQNGVLISVDPSVTDLIIPKSAGITKIGPDVMNSWNEDMGEYGEWYNDTLKTVILPNTVTEIQAAAFCGCRNLSYVKLPSYLKIIGDQAFEYCSSLKSIYIPDSVEEIGWIAFDSAGLEGELLLPKSLKVLKESAFSFTNISSVIIPGSLISIGNQVFYNTESLNNVVFEEGIEELGWSMFEWGYLDTVKLPYSLKEINGAFNACYVKNLIIDNVEGTLNVDDFYDTNIIWLRK